MGNETLLKISFHIRIRSKFVLSLKCGFVVLFFWPEGAQVIILLKLCNLVWGVKKGWSVLPKSVTPERVKANFELDDWDLTDEEVAKIDALPDRFKVCGDSWLLVKVFFGDHE